MSPPLAGLPWSRTPQLNSWVTAEDALLPLATYPLSHCDRPKAGMVGAASFELV